MPGIRERLRTWYGPTRRELQDEIAALEDRQRKFSRAGQSLASGAAMQYGEFRYDTNTKLRGAKKHAIYERMETDPHVKGALLDKALPLLTAEWEIKPASDDAKDVEIAEFVAANLLRESSDKYGREYWIETSWKAQRLPEILSMLLNGFSLFASSWRRVGTKVVYDRLQWIEPSTLDGTQPWEITRDDRIIAVNRKLTTPTEEFLIDERITADKLKLYVWDLKGARFEGRSLFRSMYGAYLRKEFILRQATIWAQKVGAPTPIGHYPSTWNQTEITRFKKLVMAMRGEASAEAFGMFRKASDGTEADVKYVGSETGEVDRMRGLIRGENEEIHHAGASSSSMLGETDTGSRALGDSKGKREIKFTQAIAEVIAEWENHGPANLSGVVEELVDRNFDVDRYPSLVCTRVDPYENFAETIEAWNAGIIPKTPDSRRQITEGTLGLNLPDEDYEVEEPLPMQPPGAAPGVPNDQQDQDPSQVAAEASEGFRRRLAHLLEPVQEGQPRKGLRFPNSVRGGVRQAGRGARSVSGGGA